MAPHGSWGHKKGEGDKSALGTPPTLPYPCSSREIWPGEEERESPHIGVGGVHMGKKTGSVSLGFVLIPGWI